MIWKIREVSKDRGEAVSISWESSGARCPSGGGGGSSW